MRRSELLGISCGVALLAGTAGAAPEPLRMAVTDISGLEMLQAEFGAFRDILAKATRRKVAFGPVGSTSDHLAPAQLLADAGLDPQRDVIPAHIDRNVAWEALKRGDVAAVALGYRKLSIVREREKELPPGAFRVIARGPDLPNDVLVAGSHVSPEKLALVRRTFVEHSGELVAAILAGQENQKNQGMKFIANVDDGDYEYVRSMYRSIGRPQLAEFVGE